jgi:hypothetical protein
LDARRVGFVKAGRGPIGEIRRLAFDGSHRVQITDRLFIHSYALIAQGFRPRGRCPRARDLSFRACGIHAPGLRVQSVGKRL